MFCHKYLWVVLTGSYLLLGDCLAKSFPTEWGDPPVGQAGDYIRLPHGFGQGSSTLAGWIEAQVKFIGFPKDEQTIGRLPPAVHVFPQVISYAANLPAVKSGPMVTGSSPAPQTVSVPAAPAVAAGGTFAGGFAGTKRVPLTCKYKGKTYTANLNLGRQALDKYINNNDLPDWSKKDRTGLLARVSDPGDYAINQLAAAVRRGAAEQGLNNNEMAELASAFVQQGIKYGDTKRGRGINYPFVTLYDGMGVCGDKSVLLSALLRRLGYASSLFYYYPRSDEPQDDPDNPHHMVAGILTSDRKGSYKTGYAAIESTGNSKIGAPLHWPEPKELVLTSKGRAYSKY